MVRRTWILSLCGVLFTVPVASADIRVAVSASPSPARPGETLDIEFTVTNDGPGNRTGLQLIFEYPDGLNHLGNSLFDGLCPGGGCEAQERATFDIGTLAAGAGGTFSMPLQVASDTGDGTIIVFNVEVFDALGSQVRVTDSITVNATRELELALVESGDPVSSDGVIVYTLTYGLLETSGGVLDGVLSLPLPDGTGFVSATDGGTLNGNVVEWSLGAIGPGQVGEVQATVQVNSLGEGTIIEAEATLEDILTPTKRIRYQAATRVQNDVPLKLVVVTSPDPARPGETLAVELTITNTGAFDRTGVVLTLEYPDGLNHLGNSLFDGLCPGGGCEAQERATFDIGTLGSGEQVFFRMRPIVATGTLEGKLIRFDAFVTDNTGLQVADIDVVKVGTLFDPSDPVDPVDPPGGVPDESPDADAGDGAGRIAPTMDDEPTGPVSDELPDADGGDDAGDMDANDSTGDVAPTVGGCGEGMCGAGGMMMMPLTFLGIAWMKRPRRILTRKSPTN